MNNQNLNLVESVDFRPLEAIGIGREEAIKLLVAMTPFIDLEFKARVRKVFSDEEWVGFGEEGMNPLRPWKDGVSFRKSASFLPASSSPLEGRGIRRGEIKKGLGPEEGMFLMEDKYFAKTGRYFEEEMRLLFNEYVGHLVEIVKRVKADVKTFSQAPKPKQEELTKLLEDKDYDQAANMLDIILKEE